MKTKLAGFELHIHAEVYTNTQTTGACEVVSSKTQGQLLVDTLTLENRQS